MPQIDYICLGFPKSGTTAVWYNLSFHSKINVLKRKDRPLHKQNEIYYFNHDNIYKRGRKWYTSLMKENALNFEKTPGYIFSEKALQRMKKDFPNVKVIICLRNPIDYLISFHHHRKVESLERKEKFPENFYDFTHSPCPETLNKKSYLQTGKYLNYIKEVYRIFGDNNVVILFHEKLKKMSNINQLCNALGLSKPINNYSLKIYQHPGQDVICKEYPTEKHLSKLKEYYREPNKKLFLFLKHKKVVVNPKIWV